jgi:hypothetical protein
MVPISMPPPSSIGEHCSLQCLSNLSAFKGTCYDLCRLCLGDRVGEAPRWTTFSSFVELEIVIGEIELRRRR